MSEKRFTVESGLIIDTDNDDCLCDIQDTEIIVNTLNAWNKLIGEQQELIKSLQAELELTGNTKLFSRRELERKVKEQEATIRKLQDLCGQSDYENAKLRQEIKELKAQLREKEEDEQLYANEIVKLNKEAKEVLDFKNLGGDY